MVDVTFNGAGLTVDVGEDTGAALAAARRAEAAYDVLAGLAAGDSDDAAAISYEADTGGRIVATTEGDGARRLVGMPLGQSVQDAVRATMAAPGLLLGAGTPLATPIPARARYIWSAMERDLRPDPAAKAVRVYGFSWAADPVPVSAIRRSTGATDSAVWTQAAITCDLTATPDYARLHQFRDLSPLYDRVTGTTWLAVNSILGAEYYGFTGTSFHLAKSTDGLAFTMVGRVELPVAPTHVWSPEWFVDDNGEVYIIVSANAPANTIFSGTDYPEQFEYHLLRATDLEAAAFDYVGKLAGKVFPRIADFDPATSDGAGIAMNMIDPAMFKRDGVYHVVWKSENRNLGADLTWTGLGDRHPYGTLGWAASTSLLGPYDQGGPFRLPDASLLRGEGPSVSELPTGATRRFRLWFDDYLTLYGGGLVFADTDDFVNFPGGVQATDVPSPYYRHGTFVIGL